MKNPYAIPNAQAQDAISNLQAKRKQAEREPLQWDEYRKALIQCGLVEERRVLRNEHD